MVLEGGNNIRWSVQIPKTIFFKKLSIQEIKENYEKEIEKLEQRNLEIKFQMRGLSEDSNDFKFFKAEFDLNEKTIESYRKGL